MFLNPKIQKSFFCATVPVLNSSNGFWNPVHHHACMVRSCALLGGMVYSCFISKQKGAHNYIIAYFMHAPTLIATFLFLSIQSEGWLSPTILILPGLSSDGDLTACLIFFLAAPGFWNTWLVALNGEVTIVSWFFLKTFKDTEMLRKSTKHIANPMKFGSHFITIRGPTSTWLRICDWC